jgi:5-hydroxyisourate hydrolase-like protein (transthyretin family)
MLQFEVQKAYTTQDAQKGRPARPQHLRKVEVEVKVEQRSDSFHLHLNLSLNLNLLESWRAFSASC